MTPGEELLFLALGGSGEIGMNVNLYGCRGKWLMADLGLTFADPDYPGVELILPDLEFIEQRMKDLVGIVLTHGHEDHIGALPYLAADLKVPLYATPFTAGLIAGKLDEEGLTGQVSLRVIDRGGSIDLDPFRVTYVPLAHSIPEGNGLLIETPLGNIFHTGDWKIDETPVLGHPSSAETLTEIGDRGVLALVCDSTNAFLNDASGSESSVHETLRNEVLKARGRVLITTFASNAARLETIGRVAIETNRRVVVAGRPSERKKPFPIHMAESSSDGDVPPLVARSPVRIALTLKCSHFVGSYPMRPATACLRCNHATKDFLHSGRRRHASAVPFS